MTARRAPRVRPSKPVVFEATVEGGYQRVHEAVRARPTELVEHAFQTVARGDGSIEAHVGPLRTRRAHLPVRVEFWSPTSGDDNAVIHLRWSARRYPQLFPEMVAGIRLHPDGTRTTLAFEGVYRPPFGLLGALGDTLVGHRVAEASARTFLREFVAAIHTDLDTHGEPGHAQRFA